MYKRQTGIRTQESGARYQLEINGGEQMQTDHLVLAIGHSARDTFEMLQALGMSMQPKAFAVGLRMEHPQAVSYTHLDVYKRQEFVERLEPSDFDADMIVGSLIKNPGGGLAPIGGYIAGTKECVCLLYTS